MLKHNPKLTAGKLIIQHVTFEKKGVDDYGYPVTKYNAQGEPMLKDLKMYELPYLRREVRALITWLNDNK
jgi:hypothetical protein